MSNGDILTGRIEETDDDTIEMEIHCLGINVQIELKDIDSIEKLK